MRSHRRPQGYTYVVAAERRRAPRKWLLSVLLPNGDTETITTYRSRGRAIETARLLAFGAGHVEVRA